MKLLFDQNLSPRLVTSLNNIYPDSSHVYLLNLDRAPDIVVWEYARLHEYILVTRDADFSELSVLRGFPPKVIWVRRGNCATSDIRALLRLHRDSIEILENDPTLGVIELF